MPPNIPAPSETPEQSAPVPLWQGGTILPPNSHFSQEIFKLIRPKIPNEAWPVGQPVVCLFMPIPSGMALVAEFEHLPAGYKKQAEQTIMAKGVSLVKDSPAAIPANTMFKAKRWRDIFMFALLPLVFAIPIVDGLFNNADHIVTLIAGLDLVGLVLAQIRLGQTQTALVEARFIAQIPTPGMRIKLS